MVNKLKRTKLWNTSWTWQQVAAEIEKKAPSRANLYRSLHTHEYMTCGAIVKAIGKDPTKDSHVTQTLQQLGILREQGLIVVEKEGGQGGKLKYKKCKNPLQVPQESPRKHTKKRGAERERASRPRAEATNGDKAASAAHPNPLSNILDSLKGLATQVTQLASLVEAEIDREAAEVENMQRVADQLNQSIAARQSVRRGAGKNTRH